MGPDAQIILEGLSSSEIGFYSLLCSWADCSDPLRFIWQVLNSRPAIDGQEPALWHVLSASEPGKFYLVDIESRLCNCEGFYFRHSCSHIRVADRAARFLYYLLNPTDTESADSITHTSASVSDAITHRRQRL